MAIHLMDHREQTLALVVLLLLAAVMVAVQVFQVLSLAKQAERVDQEAAAVHPALLAARAALVLLAKGLTGALAIFAVQVVAVAAQLAQEQAPLTPP